MYIRFISFLWILFFSQASFAACLGLGCNCTIAANSFNFGTYDPLSSINTDSTGAVSVTCSALVVNAFVNYDVQLATGASGSYATRTMVNGANHLGYNLYTDVSRSLIWGNGSGGTSIVNDGYLIALLAPVTRNYTVYGRIPAEQVIPPGMYTDSIVATVVF